MSDELFFKILGGFISVFGLLFLIIKVSKPLKKGEGEYTKSSYTRELTLAISLILWGLILALNQW